jgi:hypothetical protein
LTINQLMPFSNFLNCGRIGSCLYRWGTKCWWLTCLKNYIAILPSLPLLQNLSHEHLKFFKHLSHQH